MPSEKKNRTKKELLELASNSWTSDSKDDEDNNHRVKKTHQIRKNVNTYLPANFDSNWRDETPADKEQTLIIGEDF